MKIDARNAREYVRHMEAVDNMVAEISRIPVHKRIGQAQIYARLRRLEMKARRMAEAECNGTLPEGAWEKFVETTTRTIERIFGGPVPGFFVNGDPRGYALKIDPSHGKVPAGMSTDPRGYGVLAPAF